ncbi:two-component sensor histidine kinase [Rhizobium phaseoli]|uniref:sensor histidine kinase n=1 Tax=Rhizobium phaseoli TaxID=396 RepID=UPI000D6778A3|nr:HAMP domain-containing sensor histidine kinase [Rhizobium phaseoli]PWI49853.1 two-component sensor histidine kinase [Rhizobium phaseoli]
MRLASLQRSTPFRLSLTFGVLFIVTFIGSGAIMYHILRAGLAQEMDASLHELNSVIASTYAPDDMEDLIATLNSYVSLQTTKEGLYSLVDPKGVRLAGNFTAIKIPPGTYTIDPQDIGSSGSDKFRIEVTQLGPNLLVVGESFADMEDLLKIVLISLGWAAVLVVTAALGGGVFLAIRAQNRLDAVAKTMLDVSIGRLDSRIPLQGRNDDLDLVSMQINSALDRLSGLVEGMRQVSADIAHELKTPLNRMKMTLDDAIRGASAGRNIAPLLMDARAESDQINATFEALLRISQIEAGDRRQRFQKVDLADVLTFVEEVYTSVAEDNGQEVVLLAPPITEVLGDKELLTQMVVNLVENAITHCPTGTRIEMSLLPERGKTILKVSDNGLGIPAEERDKVFRRLYRVEKSRTTPGSGLGLSLVRAIADLHSAHIDLADNEPGLEVSVAFRPIGSELGANLTNL